MNILIILGIFLLISLLVVLINKNTVAFKIKDAFDSLKRQQFYNYLQDLSKEQIGERKTRDGSTVRTYLLKDDSKVEVRFLREYVTEVTILSEGFAQKIKDKWTKTIKK